MVQNIWKSSYTSAMPFNIISIGILNVIKSTDEKGS